MRTAPNIDHLITQDALEDAGTAFVRAPSGVWPHRPDSVVLYDLMLDWSAEGQVILPSFNAFALLQPTQELKQWFVWDTVNSIRAANLYTQLSMAEIKKQGWPRDGLTLSQVGAVLAAESRSMRFSASTSLWYSTDIYSNTEPLVSREHQDRAMLRLQMLWTMWQLGLVGPW